MPPTATDFAVRLSPLKISYFFLPAASDGLIFVSEVHFALKLLSYGKIFLLCFPLFFRLCHPKTVCVLLRTCQRQHMPHSSKPLWWLVYSQTWLSADALSHFLVMAYLRVFWVSVSSGGITGGQGGCMGEERGKEGNTGAGVMMQEAGRKILQNRKGSLQFHRSRGQKHPGRPSHAYPRSLPCGRCLPSHNHFPVLPPVR